MSIHKEHRGWKAAIWLGLLLLGGALLAAIFLSRQLPMNDSRVESSRSRSQVESSRSRAPSSTNNASPFEPIDRALDQRVRANLAFNAPDHGRVGEKLLIDAKLSTRLTPAELKELVRKELQDLPGGSGSLEGAELRVSSRMVASLSGGPAFDISPDGPQEQWVSDNEVTSWLWEATPKVAGRHTLILRLEAVVSVEGRDGRRNIEPFIRPIDVSIAEPKTIEEWLEYIRKNGENVSWIWGTLILPAAGAIWIWIRKRNPPEAGKS